MRRAGPIDGTPIWIFTGSSVSPMLNLLTERSIMPTLPKTNSAVTEIAASDPADAQRHFERLLSLETDCWDVHAAIAGGHPDFVILDVRSPALYAAGHVPGAINLPHGRINERNLRGSPPKCCSWCTATDRTATAPIEARLDWAAWGGR